jgi:hypothetical protein
MKFRNCSVVHFITIPFKSRTLLLKNKDGFGVIKINYPFEE